MRKKRQLSVVLDGEKYRSIEIDAANRGISVAEFARRRLFEEPLPPERDDEETEDDAE